MTLRSHQSVADSPMHNPRIDGNSGLPSRTHALAWALLLAPIGYLWFRLIDNLRVEWATNPQYGYGSLVPFLCLGLIFRRSQGFVPGKSSARPFESGVIVCLLAVLPILYLPTRLVEAAVPEWRPIQWLLGVETVGLTLVTIWFAMGRAWLRQLAFPIVFFFVAIPWPTIVEAPIIQGLTRISSAFVIEMLGVVGIPAMAHGNLIEVGTGVVGIDEACSGIRSFQSSLMISLFLGEFYGLRISRRLLLVPIGFALSMTFNVARMFLLTLIAANKGVGAISRYHDPAGISIAITCTLALWALAVCLEKGKSNKPTTDSLLTAKDVFFAPSTLQASASHFSMAIRFAIPIIVSLTLIEVGVGLWYRHLESRIKPGPEWSVIFPTDNLTLRDLPMSDETRNLLRFDGMKQASWTEPDATKWQAFYFDWLPGRVAGYLAKRHTPEICLKATGCKMVSGPNLNIFTVNNVELPVRSYIFETTHNRLYVFHCRWEVGVGRNDYVEHESARFNLVRAVWAGRGNHGQKVVEIIVSGFADADQAQAAVVKKLESMIQVNSL